MKELLRTRKVLKSKKPKFIRQQGHGLKNLSKVWRAPKGMHSKLRKKLRGKLKSPSIGYSSPRLVRGLTPSGLRPILVHTESQLANLEKNEGVIIARKVGKRKRINII